MRTLHEGVGKKKRGRKPQGKSKEKVRIVSGDMRSSCLLNVFLKLTLY